MAKHEAISIAYKIVYDYWLDYIAKVRKPFSAGLNSSEKNLIEDDFVKDAKKLITDDLYPFTDDSEKWCKRIWYTAIKDMSMKLFDGYCPEVTVTVGKNKKVRRVMWY